MFLSLARKNGRQNLVDGETLQKIRYSTIGSSLGVIKITEPNWKNLVEVLVSLKVGFEML